MKAAILSAGYGTRLRPLTDYICKAMVPVAGIPVTERVIVRLRDQGFSEFIVAVSHFAEQCVHYFGDGSRFDVCIEYSINEKPQGTAGEIAAMRARLENEALFLIHYGDIISNLDIKGLVDRQRRTEAAGTIGLVQSFRVPTGIADVDADGRVTHFVEKPPLPQPTNAAIMVFPARSLGYFKKGEDISTDTIPTMIARGERIEGFIDPTCYWHDVGQPALLAQAGEALKAEEAAARARL